MASPRKPSVTTLKRVAILLALFALGGWLGRLSTFHSGSIAVWPASGIALAVILMFGWRYWPGIVVGALLFSTIDRVPLGLFALANAIGNVLGALACAFVLKKFADFKNELGHPRAAALYVLVTAALGATVNAACLVGGLVGAKLAASEQILPLVGAWWIPNALSFLLVTPAIIIWPKPTRSRRWVSLAAEGLLAAAALVASALLAFDLWRIPGWQDYPLALLPYPALLWLALRSGVRGAVTGNVLLAMLAILALTCERGPFAVGDAADSLQWIEMYLGILATANLLFAVAMTERRRVMADIVENEKRLRMVITDQTDLLCRFEPEGTLTFVNPAFGRFYGKEPQALLGENFFQVVEATDATRLRASLEALPEENPVLNIDRYAAGANGRNEWHQCSIRRLVREDGQTEYQAVMQNITPRKRAELAAQDAKHALEQMNFQLQAAATESRDAAAQANRANQSKSEFLANMSHEIRTPLSGILGMVELLAQSRLDKRQREFADAAVESANALLRVINDVLDFSKIEAGKMTVSSEDFSVRSVVDSVLENVAARSTGKKVALTAIVRRDIPHRLTGDPIRLRQVLLNLVGNGIKFTERGEVVVRVQSQFQSPGKNTLRFEVIDTGIGLTADEISKLFQPFMQADTSSSRKFGGTGLGLAISRKIIGLLNGKIGVNSVPGQGSTFWFEVPFEVPPQPVTERSYPGLVFLQATVAAPDASLRESLVEQLQGWGVDCRAVATAGELSRLLRNNLGAAVIPLVICDDEMLTAGGEELSRLLVEKKDIVSSILLANPAGSLGMDAAGPAGFVNVLLKPVRQQPLFDALLAVVDGAKPDLKPAVEPADGTEFITRAAATPKRTAISDLRILAAEDHPFNRKLCQLILDNFGARAEWAFNGQEAVDKFQPGKFDAILMDCNMPELDGLEATGVIRKIEKENKVTQRVRIIAITANALVGERERCLAAGVDDYISKPYTAQQLYQSLLAAVPPAADNGEAFDPAKLDQLCNELNREGVVEMADDFIKELPMRLAEVQRYTNEQQWTELERATHSLKGLCALFGLRSLAEAFLAIEDAADGADAQKINLLLANLPALAESGGSRIRRWLDSQNPPPVV